jgi:urease subunit beta
MKSPTKHSNSAKGGHAKEEPTPVGGYVLRAEPIQFNEGRPAIKMKVRNTGDRPIQVGSHFHFFEVNRALEFDRSAAFGLRLNISSTTAIRFEPGDEKEVSLVPFAGKQRVCGFNGLVNGWTGGGPTPGYHPDRTNAIRRAQQGGFKSTSK